MFRFTPTRAVSLTAAAALMSAGLAQAAPKDDVQAAVQKLSDAKSYSYTTTNAGGGPGGGVTGKVEKDGYTSLAMTMRDNTMDAVKKGDRAAVQTDDGWKTPAELQDAQGPQRYVGTMIRNYKAPAEQAEQILKDVPDLTKADDGTYKADLSEASAKTMMTMGRGRRGGAAPQVSGAKGSVEFAVADGMLSKMVVHVSGTVTRNGNDQEVDRTTTTEIKDVNATTADVPAEAKAKLDAAPATQP